jgi:hypothetical protein
MRAQYSLRTCANFIDALKFGAALNIHRTFFSTVTFWGAFFPGATLDIHGTFFYSVSQFFGTNLIFTFEVTTLDVHGTFLAAYPVGAFARIFFIESLWLEIA